MSGPTGKDYFRQTLAAVAASHGVRPADILGPSMARHITPARQEAAWRLRSAKDALGRHRFSYPKIGEWMGVHHTTVIHAVRRHEARTGRADR